MRAVVGRKSEGTTRNDSRKTFGVAAEAGKTLGECA
jgi:hypothetical protein